MTSSNVLRQEGTAAGPLLLTNLTTTKQESTTTTMEAAGGTNNKQVQGGEFEVVVGEDDRVVSSSMEEESTTSPLQENNEEKENEESPKLRSTTPTAAAAAEATVSSSSSSASAPLSLSSSSSSSGSNSNSQPAEEETQAQEEEEEEDQNQVNQQQTQTQPFNTMLQMTLELVQDIITARVGDLVMTSYGRGVVLSRGTTPTSTTTTEGGGESDSESSPSSSYEIQLNFGKLYVRNKDLIHKILPEDEYDTAIDQLEQARSIQILSKCEQYNIPMCAMTTESTCVCCLFRTNNNNYHSRTQQSTAYDETPSSTTTENNNVSSTSPKPLPPSPTKQQQPFLSPTATSSSRSNNNTPKENTNQRRWAWREAAKIPSLSYEKQRSNNTADTADADITTSARSSSFTSSWVSNLRGPTASMMNNNTNIAGTNEAEAEGAEAETVATKTSDDAASSSWVSNIRIKKIRQDQKMAPDAAAAANKKTADEVSVSLHDAYDVSFMKDNNNNDNNDLDYDDDTSTIATSSLEVATTTESPTISQLGGFPDRRELFDNVDQGGGIGDNDDNDDDDDNNNGCGNHKGLVSPSSQEQQPKAGDGDDDDQTTMTTATTTTATTTTASSSLDTTPMTSSWKMPNLRRNLRKGTTTASTTRSFPSLTMSPNTTMSSWRRRVVPSSSSNDGIEGGDAETTTTGTTLGNMLNPDADDDDGRDEDDKIVKDKEEEDLKDGIEEGKKNTSTTENDGSSSLSPSKSLSSRFMIRNLSLRGGSDTSSSQAQNRLATPMNTNTSIFPSGSTRPTFSSWTSALKSRRGGGATGIAENDKDDVDDNAKNNPQNEVGAQIQQEQEGRPTIEDELGDILGDEFTSDRWRQAAGTVTTRDAPPSGSMGNEPTNNPATSSSSSSLWVPSLNLRGAAASFQSRDRNISPNNKAPSSSSSSSWVSSFRLRSSSTPITGQNNADTATSGTSHNNKQDQQRAKSPTPKAKAKAATEFCHVCGNPVCQAHSKTSSATSGKRMLFCMCLDCSLDLHSLEHNLNPHHPELAKTLQRLVYYYTRMMLHLSFCLPRLQEVGHHLTQTEQRHSQISLGTSGIGFVGAALGVAGTAAMLTPAGPAILIAAIATSATSGTLQMTHASYKSLYTSQTTANQLADKVIVWHGLCLGILQGLEQLRMDLLTESKYLQENTQNGVPPSGRTAAYRKFRKNDEDDQGGVWNNLAVGGYLTTRHTQTAVNVTAAMGTSYSQAINATLQGVPVVGAAFCVGCMAMDAHNIQSSLKQLQQPSQKADALKQVQDSFLAHIPNTIMEEVLILGAAMEDLRSRFAQQRLEQELEEREKIIREEEELLEQELKALE